MDPLKIFCKQLNMTKKEVNPEDYLQVPEVLIIIFLTIILYLVLE